MLIPETWAHNRESPVPDAHSFGLYLFGLHQDVKNSGTVLNILDCEDWVGKVAIFPDRVKV